VSAHPCQRATFTTYALSLSFFEAVNLDALIRGGGKQAFILADVQGLRARQHDHAKLWASANRELIALRIFDRLGKQGVRIIDVCHNSVEPVAKEWLHRKGAAPSTQGPVVIPGSRGAFSYLAAPKKPNEN
jgi:hypothetical protein